MPSEQLELIGAHSLLRKCYRVAYQLFGEIINAHVITQMKILMPIGGGCQEANGRAKQCQRQTGRMHGATLTVSTELAR